MPGNGGDVEVSKEQRDSGAVEARTHRSSALVLGDPCGVSVQWCRIKEVGTSSLSGMTLRLVKDKIKTF